MLIRTLLAFAAFMAFMASGGLVRGQAVEEVPIGTIFSVWDSYKDVFTAMQYALERHTNDSGKLFQFKMYADNIRTVDAYKLTRYKNLNLLTCS